MFVKPLERERARALRRQGQSIKTIARELMVSPSSVSRWTSDIELSDAQVADLAGAARTLGTERRRRSALAARLEAQAHGRALARTGNLLHLTGCMLYWGEGSKGRNAVIFTNCDVEMLALFRRFLSECYQVEGHRFRFSVNVHLGNGLALADIEQSWLRRLDLPPSCVCRSQVAPARPHRHRLVDGTARLFVCSTFIVQSIYGAIQEYAGMDRPEWVH